MDERASLNAALYDLIAGHYVERNTNPSNDFTDFRDQFVSVVSRNGTVADLGCGPGRDVATLTTAGMRVVGVDLSLGMLARASTYGLPVIRGDICLPPIAHGSCDGIWSSASLLHVPIEHTLSTLTTWRALVKPAGILGLSTSLGGTDGWEHGWELTPHDPETQSTIVDTQRWFVHRDPQELVDQITKAGFDITHVAERVSHRHWFQVLARAS
jgi:SAM-dependent methyltransferase